MTPKRGDEVAPPAVAGEWVLRFATNEAAKGWGEPAAEAPGNTRRCFDALRRDPQTQADPDRQHRLRGRLAERTLGGTGYPQWEYEVTSGGRVRYLVDEVRRTVWLVSAGTRHPKDTE